MQTFIVLVAALALGVVAIALCFCAGSYDAEAGGKRQDRVGPYLVIALGLIALAILLAAWGA